MGRSNIIYRMCKIERNKSFKIEKILRVSWMVD